MYRALRVGSILPAGMRSMFAEQDVRAGHAGEILVPPLAAVRALRIVRAVGEDVPAVELAVDGAVVRHAVEADELEPVREAGVRAVEGQDGVGLLGPEVSSDTVVGRRDVQQIVGRLTADERHRQHERAKYENRLFI